MAEFALFFSGAFLCNCVPHLVAGLMGEAFPTPFAKPRGVGDSPAVVNVVWGFFNLVVGVLLFRASEHLSTLQLMSLLAGAMAMGIFLALHFSRVKARRPR